MRQWWVLSRTDAGYVFQWCVGVAPSSHFASIWNLGGGVPDGCHACNRRVAYVLPELLLGTCLFSKLPVDGEAVDVNPSVGCAL